MTNNKLHTQILRGLAALRPALALSIPGFDLFCQPEARQATSMQQQQTSSQNVNRTKSSNSFNSCRTVLQTSGRSIQDVKARQTRIPKVRDALKNYSETLSKK